jgi:DNA mismatch repair protein MutS
MSFDIDRQSIEELNLMGKFRHGSVYHLFNQVKTRAGERLLDNWFKSPLTDHTSINARTAVFRFFQSANLVFPFDANEILLMQEYIDADNSQGRLSALVSVLVKKSLSALVHDERYRKMILGLQVTIAVLKKCYQFLESANFAGGPFGERAENVKRTLSGSEVRQLIDTDIYKSISLTAISQYNYLLRNKINAAVKDILSFIAEVDVNIAVSQVARTRGFTYAHALARENNTFEAKALFHPCIAHAAGNDIHMQRSKNVIFLTGANMAGKSTWMKSVAIGMYLAHIGFPVAAASMTFSLREGIFSSINVADNIGLGYSHFYAEVVRVKNAAEATATGKYLLLIFDELFKGTNVKDAYDGTLAVTEAFAEYTNCIFIVSTHIIEVGEALKTHQNIQFQYMPTVMDGKIPRYTYQLEEGITQDRQGMMIIRNEKILEMLG